MQGVCVSQVRVGYGRRWHGDDPVPLRACAQGPGPGHPCQQTPGATPCSFPFSGPRCPVYSPTQQPPSPAPLTTPRLTIPALPRVSGFEL